MIRRLERNKLLTIGDVVKEKHNPTTPNIALDIHQLYNSIPNEIRKHLQTKIKTLAGSNTSNMLPYKLNIWKNYESIKSRDLRLRLEKTPLYTHKELLVKKHPTIVANKLNNNPFITLRSLTITKLQDIQYKMLHNVYPTMYHLTKWGIKSNDKCESCNVIDDLKHTIFECPTAKATIKNLTDLLKFKYHINVKELNYESVLMGQKATNKFIDLNSDLVDSLLIMIKQKLILQRNNKYSLTQLNIDFLMHSLYKLEKLILPMANFTKKWSSIVSKMDIFDQE